MTVPVFVIDEHPVKSIVVNFGKGSSLESGFSIIHSAVKPHKVPTPVPSIIDVKVCLVVRFLIMLYMLDPFAI